MKGGASMFKGSVKNSLTASAEGTKAKSFISSAEITRTGGGQAPQEWETSKQWASPSNFVSNQGPSTASNA